MTFTCFTEGRHGGSQSRKQNTVPAAPFLAAHDNDCAPRGREKGPLEELVQRALHGYESFSGRLGPQAAKNLPAGGGSLPPRRPHCAARSSAAGSEGRLRRREDPPRGIASKHQKRGVSPPSCCCATSSRVWVFLCVLVLVPYERQITRRHKFRHNYPS